MKNKFNVSLNLLATIFALCGVTLFSIISHCFNNLTIVKINNAEDKIEAIKVTQNVAYIESVLGKPMTKQAFSFPTISKEKQLTGSKAVYGSDYYTLIAYFNEDDTLFGYFLISQNKLFNPRIFRNANVMNKRLHYFGDEEFGGGLYAISNSYLGRRDGSIHHLKYYYHHLGTNNCIIGIGLSSLGYSQGDIPYVKTSLIYDGTYIDYNDYSSQYKEIDKFKTNTFAIFIADDEFIDIEAFLNLETQEGLALTHIELDRLVD